MVIFSYIEYLKYSRIIKEEYSLNEEVAEYKYDNKKINHAPKGVNVGVAIPYKLRESDFVYKLLKREDDS